MSHFDQLCNLSTTNIFDGHTTTAVHTKPLYFGLRILSMITGPLLKEYIGHNHVFWAHGVGLLNYPKTGCFDQFQTINTTLFWTQTPAYLIYPKLVTVISYKLVHLSSQYWSLWPCKTCQTCDVNWSEILASKLIVRDKLRNWSYIFHHFDQFKLILYDKSVFGKDSECNTSGN